MKVCNMCKIKQDVSSFAKDKSKKDGYSPRCKECQKKLSALHYANNKDVYREIQIKNTTRRKELMRDSKSKPCADCGVQYPYWIMQFDHLRDKEFMIGYQGYRCGLDRLTKEIAKCDVVCANCHAHRTWKRKNDANA